MNDREAKFIGQAAAIGIKGLMETFSLNPDSRAWFGSILFNIDSDKDVT